MERVVTRVGWGCVSFREIGPGAVEPLQDAGSAGPGWFAQPVESRGALCGHRRLGLEGDSRLGRVFGDHEVVDVATWAASTVTAWTLVWATRVRRAACQATACFETCCVASGRAGGPGQVSRSLNAAAAAIAGCSRAGCPLR